METMGVPRMSHTTAPNVASKRSSWAKSWSRLAAADNTPQAPKPRLRESPSKTHEKRVIERDRASRSVATSQGSTSTTQKMANGKGQDSNRLSQLKYPVASMRSPATPSAAPASAHSRKTRLRLTLRWKHVLAAAASFDHS